MHEPMKSIEFGSNAQTHLLKSPFTEIAGPIKIAMKKTNFLNLFVVYNSNIILQLLFLTQFIQSSAPSIIDALLTSKLRIYILDSADRSLQAMQGYNTEYI